jgi:hypothetical protein
MFLVAWGRRPPSLGDPWWAVPTLQGGVNMRYLLSARVRPERRSELLRALESGGFGAGFPYGDLGETLCRGRVDASGTVRWVEVCYCREYYGVAMEEELPYFEEFLTDMTVTDARSPRYCEGYPACSTCDCTRKVRPKGEPFLDHLRKSLRTPEEIASPGRSPAGRPTRWLGWRGEVTPEEERRNRSGGDGLDKSPRASEINNG